MQSDRVGALLQISVKKYFQVQVEHANNPQVLQQRPRLEVWTVMTILFLFFLLLESRIQQLHERSRPRLKRSNGIIWGSHY